MVKKKTTTIVISLETKELMDKSKVHARETYDDIIKRLLWEDLVDGS